jgi:hypothetical protein
MHLHRRPAAFGSPKLVIARIHRYSGQPAGKVIIRPYLIKPGEKLDEYVLRNVFYVFSDSKEAADQSKDHRSELLDDGSLRCSVTFPCA